MRASTRSSTENWDKFPSSRYVERSHDSKTCRSGILKPSGPYFGHSETLGLDLSKLIPLAIAAIRQDMGLTSVRSVAELYPDYLLRRAVRVRVRRPEDVVRFVPERSFGASV